LNIRHSLAVLALLLFLHPGVAQGRSNPPFSSDRLSSCKSVGAVISKLGPTAESRLKPYFERAGVAYPPQQIAFIVLKDEMELELWAKTDGKWTFVHKYEVLAASGDVGPKQKLGDHQVPEGIYRIASLNPNSRFHLSMKIDYPNSFDLQKARAEKRTSLGGDIFIHGKAKSVGCVAVGDEAIEELFVVAAKTGIENVTVVIAPNDLRRWKPWLDKNQRYPSWLPELYDTITQELSKFKEKPGT
jgi:hypothetical protein